MTSPAWHAVRCLRRAETLAGLVSFVSGPADMVGAVTPQWLEDWIERARKTLDRAWTDVRSDYDSVKDKAKSIAENVQSGAQALRDMPGKAVAEVRTALDRIIDVAKRIVLYTAIGVGGAILIFIALSLLAAPTVKRGVERAYGEAQKIARKEFAS